MLSNLFWFPNEGELSFNPFCLMSKGGEIRRISMLSCKRIWCQTCGVNTCLRKREIEGRLLWGNRVN